METLARSLLVRLDRDGLSSWVERLRPHVLAHDVPVEELLLLKASVSELSTKTRAVLNQVIDLAEAEGPHREVLLGAPVWCLDMRTFDAFRLRIERFFHKDRVVEGFVEATHKLGGHSAIVSGGAAFAIDLAEARSAEAKVWFIDRFPLTVETEVVQDIMRRPPDAIAVVGPSEPTDPRYEERLVERARDDLVERRGLELIRDDAELVYWDFEMSALWHRPHSSLKPRPCEPPVPKHDFPARYAELDLVLGARSEGSDEKRAVLRLVRMLDWAAWHEDPATGDWWYEDIPDAEERVSGPPRFRRAGILRR